MEELRLPWNNREGLLYGGVIALVTCIIMSTFNIAKTFGKFDSEVMLTSLKCLPILWVIIMFLTTFIVGRIANYGVKRFTEPTDGFNTRIVFNIIFCVTMMSACMSIIGPIVGMSIAGQLQIAEVFMDWPYIWPTNFCVAFWVEMLVAQPFARMIMKRMHLHKISNNNNGGASSE
ncbi:MAG: DUF2798 domain-containing protein [Candidatus Methanomethylophilaceae archaeon]